ncbi:NAD(P)/FAD-dependent oxidoreductase [Adlercreutzia sp. ZJ138]|uniref:phytoene desaturase family protein n=1 Tax=Adlercreutzia sp. ZJ138 TaxID=2709405 RepID=UPI0013EDD7EB|nr:NAD(P)/FAD-dependent oxidoreductase [Adlercreutzia sp. ZJ138]
MEKYDVVVIGSGIGGLAAAVLLASQEKKVVVLEKNAFPGGRLSSYTKGDFVVDYGVHTISRGSVGPIGGILERCGFPDAIKFNKVRPITRLHGEDFKFPRDVAKYVSEEDFNGLMAFIQDVYSMTEERFAELDGITLDDYLDKYTMDPTVHSVVNTIGQVYCAVPGWELAMGEFGRCLQWEATARASGYPEGGCMTITNKYVEVLQELGGELKLSTPVSKVIIENGEAVGVVAGEEEYRAPVVISNADVKHTVFNLVGKENLPAHYSMKVKKLKWANAGPSLKIALDAELTDLQMFSQAPELPCAEYFSQIEDGIMPEHPYLFFVCPSNFSVGIAPEGQQLWQVATPLPTDTPESILEEIPEVVMNALDDFAPGFRDHIIWKEWFGIAPLEKMVGETGATIGAAQCVGQIGDSRLNQKTPISGLYLVGGEVGGHGVGIELAANSAIELVDEIL